jgi:hypothetical protein
MSTEKNNKKKSDTSNPVTSQYRVIFILKALLINQISSYSFLVKPLTISSTFIILIGVIIPTLSFYNIPFILFGIIPIFLLSFMYVNNIIHDILFYNSFYKSVKYNEYILSYAGTPYLEGLVLLATENFDDYFNKFRKRLKNHISKVNSPLLSKDYIEDSTFKSIDIFFDVVIQHFSQIRVYTHALHEDWMEYRHDIKLATIEEIIADNEIDGINYNTTMCFLCSFNDTFIESPKPLSTKIVAIREFFALWNQTLFHYKADLFEESKEKINEFYDKKYQKYESLISTIYRISENLFAALMSIIISIVAGIILYYALKP